MKKLLFKMILSISCLYLFPFIKAEERVSQLVDQSLLLLEHLQQHKGIYIPRVFNQELSYLLHDLSEDEFVAFMHSAELIDNDYLLNGVAAVLVDRLFLYDLDEQRLADMLSLFSDRSVSFIKKYIMLKRVRRVTRACGDVDRTAADYMSEFDMPLEHLGNIGILRFDNKELTSLYGIQDVSVLDVGIAAFNDNCILGNTLDPQFPTNAFQGLPNIIFIFLNNNKIESLPSSFFDNLALLEVVYLDHNLLTDIPTGLLSGLDELALLNLSTNMLTTVTTMDFSASTRLDTIYLDHNSLTDIPADFFQNNTMLRSIFLNNNFLPTWPPAVLNTIEHLDMLDLADNVLVSFEPESLLDGSEVILSGNLLTTSQEDFLESMFPEVIFVF